MPEMDAEPDPTRPLVNYDSGSVARARLLQRPDWQRECLHHWLMDWRIEKAWRSACDDDDQTEAATLNAGAAAPAFMGEWRDNLVKPFDPAEHLRSGCIRLPSPALVGRRGRETAVVVLGDWEPGWVLAAPFGGLSVPGSTGELLLEGREPRRRVLCLWNAITLPRDLLAQSWDDGELTGDEVKDAWSVFRHVNW